MFPLDLMVKLVALIYSRRHVPSISMATDGGLGVGEHSWGRRWCLKGSRGAVKAQLLINAIDQSKIEANVICIQPE